MKTLLALITSLRTLTDAALGGLLDFIDQRLIIRRAMIIAVLWMMIDVYRWAKGYASLPGKSGAELGLVIAALTVPASALMGFIYKTYDEGRRAAETDSTTSTDATSVSTKTTKSK